MISNALINEEIYTANETDLNINNGNLLLDADNPTAREEEIGSTSVVLPSDGTSALAHEGATNISGVDNPGGIDATLVLQNIQPASPLGTKILDSDGDITGKTEPTPLGLLPNSASGVLTNSALGTAGSETPNSAQVFNSTTGFQVIGTKVYDANGQEFIAKGANVFTWDGTSNTDNYLNTWGFNTIRVPNYLLGSWNQPHPASDEYATNHAIVDAYTGQGAVVIFDAHDRIGGYYEDEDFETLKDYWRDMAQEFKDNPNVWFNLHNEPGNATAQPEKWVSYHRELIDLIRSEGANNVIVVDGETWGQDYKTRTILNGAHEVMEGNENVMFSMHVYRQWGDGHEVGDYIDDLHNEDIPIMIGEFGDVPAAAQMMAAAQEREVGRIVWVARAADPHDLTTGHKGHAHHYDGTNPEILTDLGQLVLDDLQRGEDLEQIIPSTPNEGTSAFSRAAEPTTYASLSAATTGYDGLSNARVKVDESTDLTSLTSSSPVGKPQGTGKFELRNILFDDQINSDDGFDVIDPASNQTQIRKNQSFTSFNHLDNNVKGLDNFDDVINGRGGHDTLRGLGGDDRLRGGRGHDQLFGDGGNDQLVGNNGEDLLVGGFGDDTLTGGRGSDQFRLEVNSGVDMITDFEVGQDSVLLPKGLVFADLEIVQGTGEHANDTLIYFGQDNQLLAILSDIKGETFTEADVMAL